MTGQEAKVLAELYLNAEIDGERILLIINEALSAIGDFAVNYKTVNVSAEEAEEGIELPPTTTAVVNVLENTTPYDNWSTRGTLIKFGSSGSFTVTTRSMVEPIESLECDIPIHPLFDHAILCYLRGFLKMADDDTSPDGQAQLAKFQEETIRAYDTLRKLRSRH